MVDWIAGFFAGWGVNEYGSLCCILGFLAGAIAYAYGIRPWRVFRRWRGEKFPPGGKKAGDSEANGEQSPKGKAIPEDGIANPDEPVSTFGEWAFIAHDPVPRFPLCPDCLRSCRRSDPPPISLFLGEASPGIEVFDFLGDADLTGFMAFPFWWSIRA